ncbi:MAG: NAD-dependent epimerase/dehydratase family protein [Phascolarctobacterium sp.]|nr:NAD-dependent epimerase/dehydratase family protein [Phascolarctobacterium sp.]
MTKILVTGGAGFVGTHLLKELTGVKDTEVVVLDNLDTGSEENVPAGMNFIPLDIVDRRVEDLFNEEKFDIVIHLAGHGDVEESLDDPIEDAAINILGSLNILENSKKYGVKIIIYLACAELEENSSQQDVSPKTFCDASKLTVENYFKLYNKLYGMNCTVIKPLDQKKDADTLADIYAKEIFEEICA